MIFFFGRKSRLKDALDKIKSSNVPQVNAWLIASDKDGTIPGNEKETVEIFFDYTEAVVWMWSVKKVFLEISQNSQESTCARVSLLIKLQTWGLELHWKKETLAQVFSCEFCEIPNSTFCHRIPPVAASEDGYDWNMSSNL